MSANSTTLIILCFFFGISSFAQDATLRSSAPIPISNYGGKEELDELAKWHMLYPPGERAKEWGGTVTLRFRIDRGGSVTEWDFQDSLTAGLNVETERLFHLARWNPDKDNTNPEQYDHFFSMYYDLKKYKKVVKKRGYDNLPRPPFKVASSFLVVPENLVDTAPKYISEKYDNSFVTYLNARRRYPENAERLGLHGAVKLSYVVEPSGIISNVKALQTLGGGCTEEAVRLMRDTKWIPGQKADLAVRTEMQVVIKF